VAVMAIDNSRYLLAQAWVRNRSQIAGFRENVRQAIVNGSLPLHRKKCSKQVHLAHHQRYQQHEAGGSHCNFGSHVARKYNVVAR
jgi:hypothetical protein